jgi:hypothetical protein
MPGDPSSYAAGARGQPYIPTVYESVFVPVNIRKTPQTSFQCFLSKGKGRLWDYKNNKPLSPSNHESFQLLYFEKQFM